MGMLSWTQQANLLTEKAEERFEKVQLYLALQSELDIILMQVNYRNYKTMAILMK